MKQSKNKAPMGGILANTILYRKIHFWIKFLKILKNVLKHFEKMFQNSQNQKNLD